MIVLAKIAARFYYDPALWALAGQWVPPDGGIFIVAGGKILEGQSPYLDASALGDDVEANFGYVYPPLLAIAISPLSLLPDGPTAAMFWTVVLIACVVGALWLLGVRDWRCYLVALLWPFNRVALDWGRVDPLLVLLVAARMALSRQASVCGCIHGWSCRDEALSMAVGLLAPRHRTTSIGGAVGRHDFRSDPRPLGRDRICRLAAVSGAPSEGVESRSTTRLSV